LNQGFTDNEYEYTGELAAHDLKDKGNGIPVDSLRVSRPIGV